MFWGLYTTDRELVYPKEMDTLKPDYGDPNLWNHLVHTFPGLGVLLELFIIPHKYNSSFLKGSLPVLFAAALYSVW